MPERRRLTRSTNRLIAGVCAGLADYLDLDATLVRIGFIVLALFSLGFGAIDMTGIAQKGGAVA